MAVGEGDGFFSVSGSKGAVAFELKEVEDDGEVGAVVFGHEDEGGSEGWLGVWGGGGGRNGRWRLLFYAAGESLGNGFAAVRAVLIVTCNHVAYLFCDLSNNYNKLFALGRQIFNTRCFSLELGWGVGEKTGVKIG